MTPRTSEISIPYHWKYLLGQIFMYNMALKLHQHFYLLVKPLGCYFQVWFPYYQRHNVTRKQLFQYPWGDRSGLRKPKNKSINTNHNYLQRPSPYASLNWPNNKIRFNFNQPNRKRWGAMLVDVMKHLPLQCHLSFINALSTTLTVTPRSDRVPPMTMIPKFYYCRTNCPCKWINPSAFWFYKNAFSVAYSKILSSQY